jgi:hypothetical protein
VINMFYQRKMPSTFKLGNFLRDFLKNRNLEKIKCPSLSYLWQWDWRSLRKKLGTLSCPIGLRSVAVQSGQHGWESGQGNWRASFGWSVFERQR